MSDFKKGFLAGIITIIVPLALLVLYANKVGSQIEDEFLTAEELEAES